MIIRKVLNIRFAPGTIRFVFNSVSKVWTRTLLNTKGKWSRTGFQAGVHRLYSVHTSCSRSSAHKTALHPFFICFRAPTHSCRGKIASAVTSWIASTGSIFIRYTFRLHNYGKKSQFLEITANNYTLPHKSSAAVPKYTSGRNYLNGLECSVIASYKIRYSDAWHVRTFAHVSRIPRIQQPLSNRCGADEHKSTGPSFAYEDSWSFHSDDLWAVVYSYSHFYETSSKRAPTCTSRSNYWVNSYPTKK